MKLSPPQELARTRQVFFEALEAAQVPLECRTPLVAACEAVAKARAVCSIAELVERRSSAVQEVC